MRRRYRQLLLLALVSGALAAGLARSALRAPPGAGAAATTTPVVTAARDLSAGTVLEAGDLRVLARPLADAPDGHLTSLDAAVGAELLESLREDEPLLARAVAPAAAGRGREAGVPEGMRAMTVRVDEAAGLSALVGPGARVDVLLTAADPDRSEGSVTALVLENAVVADHGGAAQSGPLGQTPARPVVTLLVTPAQAQTLALAAASGVLKLALRNPADAAEVRTRRISIRDVLGVARPAPAATPSPTPERSVELFRGSERTSPVVPEGPQAGPARREPR